MSTTAKPAWSVSDISKPLVGPLEHEFTDFDGNDHHFTILITEDRFVFGSYTNAGFLESGYMLRSPEAEENEADDFQDLEAELSTYYDNGYEYTTRIVCNERM